nr:hypothetical protein [Mesorhizobium sp. L2C054A000]
MTNAIGLIDPDRMAGIPPQFHPHHEFCFHLYDNIGAMLAELEGADLRRFSFKLDDEHEVEALRKSSDVMDFLVKTGRMDVAQKSTVGELNLALYADLLHFLFESLRALEKSKFTVAYATLRKPLQENLLYAAWLVADEDDFFKRMKDDPADKLTRSGLTPDEHKQIFRRAIAQMGHRDAFHEDVLYDFVYDKNSDVGLAVFMNKANHLVTRKGDRLRTEEWNLNFIFKDPRDTDVYETIYPILAYVLFFILQLQIASYSRLKEINREVQRQLSVSAMGAYEALFAPGRGPMLRGFSKLLKEYLKCPFCHEAVTIKKSEAARFFILEHVACRCCGRAHKFPLYWLLSRGESGLSKEDITS